MQSHDPIQLEQDSSHPIVIPGAHEIINSNTNVSNATYIDAASEIIAPSTSEGSFAPESFQTARSFKNSPTEYPFSTSITNSHGQFLNTFGSLKNSINSTSPTANFSPRLEGPLIGSISNHRNSINERNTSTSSIHQQDVLARRNMINSKFNPSSFQIPSYQQLHQQTTQFQQQQIPKNGVSSSFNGSQQPTSSHFQTNPTSYIPYHNAPSTISSSYSSANIPNHFNTYARQHTFEQPTVKTERGGFDNLPEYRKENGSDMTIGEVEDDDTNMSDSSSDDEGKKTTTGSLLTSSLEQIKDDMESTKTTSNSLDIVNYPTEDLLMMLAALLQKIIEANDNLHPNHYTNAQEEEEESSHVNSKLNPENKFIANVLAFHGRNVPAISIQAYLSRILKYCPVTNEVFLTLLVYFDRIAKRANAGDFNTTPVKSEEEGHVNDTPEVEKKDQLFVMDSYNIHRLIIAGITVASKFFSDIFYKNSRYAKVGGLPLEELNHLEIQFLLLTDFKLLIQTEELQRYADLLLKFWAREQDKSN